MRKTIDHATYTPLMVVIGGDSSDNETLECFYFLVDHPKVNINAVTSSGTAVTVAIFESHGPCLKSLLERGADPNIIIENGPLPTIHLAANTISSTCLKILLDCPRIDRDMLNLKWLPDDPK